MKDIYKVTKINKNRKVFKSNFGEDIATLEGFHLKIKNSITKLYFSGFLLPRHEARQERKDKEQENKPENLQKNLTNLDSRR